MEPTDGSAFRKAMIEPMTPASAPARFRIVHLVDAPEAASTLARWFVAEWEHWYGPDGPGDAASDLAASRSRDELPLCLVAVSLEGRVLGTAALKTESIGSELGVGPWLAALLVGTPFRGKGIGTALVAAVEREARRLGFGALYTSTDSADGLLLRRGWQAFGTTRSLRGRVTVYRRPLPDGES